MSKKFVLHVNSCCHGETFHAFREYSAILNIQRRKTEHYSSPSASRPEHTFIFATLILLQSVILIYDVRNEEIILGSLSIATFVLCHAVNFLTFSYDFRSPIYSEF